MNMHGGVGFGVRLCGCAYSSGYKNDDHGICPSKWLTLPELQELYITVSMLGVTVIIGN